MPRRSLGFVLRYYAALLRDALSVFESGWGRFSFWSSTVLLTVAGVFAPEWSAKLLDGVTFSRWWALLPLGLALFYAALRVNYEHYRKLEKRIEKLATNEERQATVDALAELKEQGDNLYAERLPDSYHILDWKERLAAWCDSVVAHLDAHFTRAIRGRFQSLGPILQPPFAHAVDAQHAHELAMLSRRLNILDEIIKDHTATFRLTASPVP